jgi:hypothetical protein
MIGWLGNSSFSSSIIEEEYQHWQEAIMTNFKKLGAIVGFALTMFTAAPAPMAVVAMAVTVETLVDVHPVEAKTPCKSGALTTHCTTVTDQSYKGGGAHPKTVPIEACLEPSLTRMITLPNGTMAWEAGFYYGNGQPEVVVTVKNTGCWTKSKDGKVQTGAPGTWAVAFVCCKDYCGWTGGKIGADGKATLSRIKLPKQHDPLANMLLADGQYDRSKLLH